MKAQIKSFFDKATWTFTYVVSDPEARVCIVIDPVLNYDPKSGRTLTQSADQVLEYITSNQLQLEWILETHAHADHLTAAKYLQDMLGGKIAIGEKVQKIQGVFKGIFNLGDEFKADGSQFDHLIKDGENISFGNLNIESIAVPGHTPACLAYKIDDAIFVGDTLFPSDVGTARCDFPGGDANTLYKSIKKILSYPESTNLYMCHDYPPTNRQVIGRTTVGEQRENNIHIRDGVTEDAFVQMRKARDATLEVPVLLLPSIQVNIRAGAMPPKEDNGTSYMKIPINLL
ncbi:glyoxylase-like metal-dependent hydrolase (beta-lactamase superfamily II) [Polynucleobacter sphagniphilus]|jgi:glyoxylase-like metal-dependent hydrolase (beta-lactamase superfamily II)|uniref:Glyoxylase-like metal-dependent hydrolase (Beta-lactamase superfamily II) n=1 Tax=Polynucleobacter sphagniphilus TaxID=1743169 RepID=A0AA43MCE9_9BURK|nr:MBL fold metallo-hydrolase [Polynucleobacter sphagniphilus]MDH6240753.1 glyoxylase-like metal-dependent hydrolase (beta-lactamase superfamily II) [Polynucleobacter sphagniphilus]MDH6505004.1 glyoxylase-like metal-dependent hydrolase (beta-lactamase superfamily II) [Polynucleobacter sphagniphilus]MDH6513531.1 glyoxylase-like metal-dependent hydrolase (beta-lactamase superfamily II) [Polynucleobacter sphagniphilus]